MPQTNYNHYNIILEKHSKTISGKEALSKERKQNEKENNILKKITYGKNLKVCFVTTYIMSISNSAMYLEEKDEFIEEELFDEDTEYLSEDKGESNRLITP